jgi:hypothetical protein
MADDKIAKIEAEAIHKTEVSDWAGARELFEHALTLEMPASRRASILRNVAGTYWKEGNRAAAAATSRRAIALLDSEGPSSSNLRNELLTIETLTSGKVPLRTSWYALAFIAGIYWGISIASGAPIDPKLVYIGPPLLCIVTAAAALGGWNSRVFLGAVTLYASFLFSFAIGYSLGASGLIRFGYKVK